ncbi:cytochrome c biogenesis protein DipZ [Mycobacterium montefiorense]|uniref:Protein DipZ n=1 Tax=Mycobacterium montefiorense TaxID=154654 RepID=A0AA37PPN7_9MYCO|nr:cytochrome c biogenesis protein DipZ [Mycobacterium montefiorense]GBG40530.1 protein DipZ [Mycobacterium montefiorense]GKU36371.1 protein DipZ [Mycobacterium montefiorense]GKU39301.1 protein DipZ [Mycobacterium montefiorense]GKU44710.1 protein DipZ [Mycobacterium montefiorense]GKU54096.1 protein DipZ [Mycobacterium montefiorense]
MQTIALIGFLGGLITGISPCILPVLPVIFLSSMDSGTNRSRRSMRATTRPYMVIGGLVCSFSLATLIGSALLSALHLPQDAIRWAALVVLALIGLGLIFPPLQHLIERPFAFIPQRQIGSNTDGFGLGLTLGALYVPCAGPVLAAIVVAGGTASLGAPVLILTATFALGNAIPLLAFALAGRHVAERVAAFRRRQRQIQIAGGVMMIVLAVALVFNLPAMLQRAVPDYTTAMQNRLDTKEIQHSLIPANTQPPASASVLQLNQGNTSNGLATNCTDGSTELQQCGQAPSITGITGWLNTPDNKPLDPASVRGKVVLIDFWAYSCINCQRAIPHVVDWYNRYRDSGLVVIGVHTPEYAFERIPDNVASGAAGLHIDYPIALDNDYATWNAFNNMYWPAEYLIDANGTLRHTKFGEGDYDGTEKLIRQLLVDANPNVALPAPVNGADTTPKTNLTPETYLAPDKATTYGGDGSYQAGTAGFNFPAQVAADKFALRGRWTLDDQGVTADSDDAAIRLNYTGKSVYAVVGGTGTITVTRDGQTTTTQIGGAPTLHQIVADNGAHRDQLDMQVSKGLQVFSFTFG